MVEHRLGWTRNLRPVLDAVVGVVLIVAAGMVIAKNWPWGGPKRSPPTNFVGKVLSIEGSPVKGRPAAALGMVVFSDFQCPYCSAFAKETLPKLEEAFVQPGIVQIIFKHFPLPAHKSAVLAAEAAACAQQSGLFWDVHDRLFGLGKALDSDQILGIGDSLGLSTDWRQCVESQRAAIVTGDRDEATALGVRSTPTIVMGHVSPDRTLRVESSIEGARPYAEFERALARLTR